MQKHILEHPSYFVAFLLVCCSLILGGCQAVTVSEIPADLTYALTRDFKTLDPHIDDSREIGIVLRQIYDTLIYKDPSTGEFVAGLATDWNVSEDGLTYSFRLRNDVQFHDGTPFNAQAVAVNLDRIVNPQINSTRALALLGTYEGYTLVDEYTIQLRLSAPFAPFLDNLSQFYLGMASPTALADYSTLRYQFHQVGTGAYRLVEYLPGSRVLLERNDNYTWNPSFYTTPTAQRPRYIAFNFALNENQRAEALINGNVDVVGALPPLAARSLAVNAQIQLLPQATQGLSTQLLMNTTQYPTDNLLIRQALLYGTNRNEIIDRVYQGFAPVAWGAITSNTPYYSQEMFNLYSYDAIQARNLIASAGFTDANNDGIFELSGIPLEVRLIVSQQSQLQNLVPLLVEQWRIIGIQMNVTTVATNAALVDILETGEYNLVAINEISPDPYVLQSYFSSEGEFAWTNYSNAQLDELLQSGAQQRDPIARAGAYVLAQRQIMENALTVPIWEPVVIHGANSRVQNLLFERVGDVPLLGNVQVMSN